MCNPDYQYCMQAYQNWVDWMADDAAFYNQLLSLGGYQFVPYYYSPPTPGGNWYYSDMWAAHSDAMWTISNQTGLPLDWLLETFPASYWDITDASTVNMIVDEMLYRQSMLDIATAANPNVNLANLGFYTQINADGTITSIPLGFQDVAADMYSDYQWAMATNSYYQQPDILTPAGYWGQALGESMSTLDFNANGGVSNGRSTMADLRAAVSYMEMLAVWHPGAQGGFHWEWDISDGRMSIVSADGGVRQAVATGYAGYGQYRNNPAETWRQDLGPIPAGWYDLTGVSGSKGVNTIVLNPQTLGQMTFLDPATNTNITRHSFLIHGVEPGSPAYTSSEGCIIAPPNARVLFAENYSRGFITTLQVVD